MKQSCGSFCASDSTEERRPITCPAGSRKHASSELTFGLKVGRPESSFEAFLCFGNNANTDLKRARFDWLGELGVSGEGVNVGISPPVCLLPAPTVTSPSNAFDDVLRLSRFTKKR